MRIGEREIGPGRSAYVIAEVGVNHDGSVERAFELIDAAAAARADAVKFQYFETDRLLSGASVLAPYQRDAGETDATAMLRRLELTSEELGACAERARARGLHAIVTVFSVELVERAAELGWDAYKSASPDVVNRPLLEALAGCGKPLIVSTGAAELDEVERAARWLDEARDRLVMLQCVSSYPTAMEAAALDGIGAISSATGLLVGYSDHTEEESTGGLAVERGACVLEKHLTYDRAAAGPDHAASLEPAGLARYVEAARRWACCTPARMDAASAKGAKRAAACEADVRRLSRQSVTTTRAVDAGELVERGMLTIKRPGVGVEPWRLDEVIGRRATRRIEADAPIMWTDVGGERAEAREDVVRGGGRRAADAA